MITHPLAFHLVAIFYLYIGLMLWFSAFYHRAYRKDRNCFKFDSDVARRQRESVALRCHRDLSTVQANLELLRMVSFALQDRTAKLLLESAPCSLFISDLRFEFSSHAGGGMPVLPISTIEAIDKAGQSVRKIHIVDAFMTPRHQSRECFAIVVNQGIKFWSRLQRMLESRLDSMSSDRPEIWSVWDFLYFSAMIQTTVGLGDILPNSSRVRALVALQAFLGYAIIALLLGIALK